MIEMTDERAAEVLAAHNEWRRYDGDPFDPDAPRMDSSKLIGRAIDHAVSRLRSQPPAEAQPVAYADPQAFINFKDRGHLGGPHGREWMWAKPDAGLVPLYNRPPRRAPVDMGVRMARLCEEASEVLEAVGASGVPLPGNWRWPLADELSGTAVIALNPPPSAPVVVDVLEARLEAAERANEAQPVAWADEDLARHWIVRYAAGIDEQPQMDMILDCVASPTSAPVGVAADILRIVDTAIDVCNDRDRPAMAEDLEAVRLYVEQASAALAGQQGGDHA